MKTVTSGGFLRNALEFFATLFFLIWLLFYGHLQLELLVDYRGGTDIMLAFVLAGVHVMLSLGLLAGSRLRIESIWAALNALLLMVFIYFCFLYHSQVGIVFISVIAVLNALFVYLPAKWFIKDSHRVYQRMKANYR